MNLLARVLLSVVSTTMFFTVIGYLFVHFPKQTQLGIAVLSFIGICVAVAELPKRVKTMNLLTNIAASMALFGIALVGAVLVLLALFDLWGIYHIMSTLPV